MTLTDFTRLPALDGPATRRLEGRLLGQVIRPADPNYDAARQVWNTSIDRRPGLIVRAADAADVLRAVEFARDKRVPLAVRSGGHSFSGLGTVDGGVVLDLGGMKGVSIDPQRRTAWVQPGATTADLGPQAQRHGLALPTGDVASVGIGGLTLGGGIGWLARKYGMTIDQLRSIEMVTADGRLVTASANEHPDLFWAVRGGGGNFGVVTAFEFNLVPVGDTALGGALVLPATQDVLEGYFAAATSAPEGLTTISMLMPAPPLPFIPAEYHNRVVLFVLLVHVGDIEAGQLALAPLRALAQPIADVVMPMPYHGIYNLTAEGATGGPVAARSGFFKTMDSATVRDLLSSAQDMAPGPHMMIQLRPLGGAMSRVPNEATAFAHRDKPYMVAVTGGWSEPEHAPSVRGWVNDTWAKLRPRARGVYVNFLGDEGAARVREAYPGATYERLVAAKRRYDPQNLFRVNQNIDPAR